MHNMYFDSFLFLYYLKFSIQLLRPKITNLSQSLIVNKVLAKAIITSLILDALGKTPQQSLYSLSCKIFISHKANALRLSSVTSDLLHHLYLYSQSMSS